LRWYQFNMCFKCVAILRRVAGYTAGRGDGLCAYLYEVWLNVVWLYELWLNANHAMDEHG